MTCTIPLSDLHKFKKEYTKLIEESEKRGIENLSYEDTEYYGAYLGKVELIDFLISKYTN